VKLPHVHNWKPAKPGKRCNARIVEWPNLKKTTCMVVAVVECSCGLRRCALDVPGKPEARRP